MKLFSKCIMCDTWLFHWWHRPTNVRLTTAEGPVDHYTCKKCDNYLIDYLNDMKKNNDNK